MSEQPAVQNMEHVDMDDFDENSARLGELMEFARKFIDGKLRCGSTQFAPKKRIVGFVVDHESDIILFDVMNLVKIAELLPALLSERKAMKAEIERFRGEKATGSPLPIAQQTVTLSHSHCEHQSQPGPCSVCGDMG